MSKTSPGTGPGAPQGVAWGWAAGDGPAARQKALRAALAAADVDLGDRDERIVAWLAGWEPSTVDTVVGWIKWANLKAVGRASWRGAEAGYREAVADQRAGRPPRFEPGGPGGGGSATAGPAEHPQAYLYRAYGLIPLERGRPCA